MWSCKITISVHRDLKKTSLFSQRLFLVWVHLGSSTYTKSLFTIFCSALIYIGVSFSCTREYISLKSPFKEIIAYISLHIPGYYQFYLQGDFSLFLLSRIAATVTYAGSFSTLWSCVLPNVGRTFCNTSLCHNEMLAAYSSPQREKWAAWSWVQTENILLTGRNRGFHKTSWVISKL